MLRAVAQAGLIPVRVNNALATAVLLAAGKKKEIRRDVNTLQHSNKTYTTGIVATVFGASGFLGRYVVDALTQVGAQVVVPFRGEETGINMLKPLGEIGQIIPVRFDVRNQASIEHAVSHSNVVINLLGRRWETRNFSYDDIHHKAAIDIAKASRHAKRYIHVSAVGVSTDHPSKWAQSKAQGEQAVKELLPHATIMRPIEVFGDEDRLLQKFGFFCQTYPILPLVHGNRKLQPLYVADFSRAVLNVLGEDETAGKTYELGGNRVFTWRELVEKIKADTLRDVHIVDIDHRIAELMANVLVHYQEPYWVPEEIKYFNQDLLPNPALPGLKELDVKATPIDTPALRVTRIYRKPIRFHEIVDTHPTSGEK